MGIREATSSLWHMISSICLVLIIICAACGVLGAPIQGPDLSNCMPVIPPRRKATEAVECCFIDTGRPIVDFKYDPSLPVRVRRPAHKLDTEFIRKYERAYEIMRSLPPHDPRSWHAQSKLHCSYCAAAYTQFNSSEVLDVHHGWFLMPFHRWFMYFHERILASLIGDDTFAIPYWAWDVQNETFPPANVIPAIFANKSSSLYDPLRCHIHQPPHRVDVAIQVEPHNKEPHELLRHNRYNMWRVMIAETKTPLAFFGGKYAKGDEVIGRAGRFETGPHAAVHGWTGSETAIFGEDMAPAYSAARDPIFFAHHSQVDRLWLMWKDLGGRDLDDPDWLDAEFLFYDEKSDLVRVRIRDCLDIEKLRISYEEEPADWLDYQPDSIRKTDPRFHRKKVTASSSRWWRQFLFGAETSLVAQVLGSTPNQLMMENDIILKGRPVLTIEVPRPDRIAKASMMEAHQASVLDEVLVIEGTITKPFDLKVIFHMFMDLPEADQNTPVYCTESLGLYYEEPEGRKGEETIVSRKFSQRIGIGERFRLLEISDSTTSVPITFVPMWNQDDNRIEVKFTELKIVLQVVR